MRAPRRLIGGLRAMFQRRRLDAELEEELRGFLEASVQDKIARGLSPDAAERAARLEIGSPAAVKDRVRDVGWESWVVSAWQDAGYALRMFRRSPGFALAAITTLALGIGATTAIFSIVDAAVLRPLPFEDPERLVTVSFRNPATGRRSTGMMPRDFLDWREHQEVFEHLSLTGGGRFTLLGAGEPEDVRVVRATEGFFEMLRVRPLLGRLFTREDELPGRGNSVILSHAFWRTHFGGAPDIVGRSLRLDETTYEVVGVLPPDFTYPAGARVPIPLFLPFTFTAEYRQHGVLQSMAWSAEGRLRPGVTSAQAEIALGQFQKSVDAAKQGSNKGYTVVVLTPMLDDYVGAARPLMIMLLGAVSIVLLIACVNVANLVIAHGTTRGREIAVRAALGASRGRLARQLLAESLVLSIIGAAAGVAIAWWALNALRSAMPGSIPRASTIGLDVRVLTFSALVALATGVISGLVPAWHASRVDLSAGFRDARASAGGAARFRLVLAAVEVSLAMTLLVGAGLFLASFAQLLRVDEGFDSSGVVSFGVSVPMAGGDHESDGRMIPAMLEAVRGVPGVTAAVVADGNAPYEGGFSSFPVRIAGRPELGGPGTGEKPMIRFRQVSAGFLEMLRVPVLYGRGLIESDMRLSAPVAVLNEAAVREFWAGRTPVGDRLAIRGVHYEIVGVVGDMRYGGPTAAAVPEVFLPYEQTTYHGGTFLVRAGDHPLTMLPAVKAAIWSVNPQVPITDVRTADDLFGRATAGRRFNLLLMSIFAVLALAIATTGVYGMLAFLVNHRTREIGVRMALGADPRDVVALFLKQGTAIVFVGVGAGLVGAWWLARTVEAFLFEVRPRDPLLFGLTACCLALAGVTACWIPARRASRIDPLISLRAE